MARRKTGDLEKTMPIERREHISLSNHASLSSHFRYKTTTNGSHSCCGRGRVMLHYTLTYGHSLHSLITLCSISVPHGSVQ